MKLGRAIQLLRGARSLNLSQLSVASGLSVSYLSLLESGDREPSMTALDSIATALQVPLAILLKFSLAGRAEFDLDAHSRSIGEGLDRLERAEQALRERLTKDGKKSRSAPVRGSRGRDGTTA